MESALMCAERENYFGGKVPCLCSKHETFHRHNNDNKTTPPQNIHKISHTNTTFIK